MNTIDVKVAELIPYVNNPRNNECAVDYVAASIKEFGFLVPVVIDKENVIVAGHTRVLAAKKLGMDVVPCVLADHLTATQIKAFRLADNKVAEFATWDESLLALELEGLDEIDMMEFGFDNGFSSDNEEETETINHGALSDKFLVPPVTILDTRGGDWIKRKRLWREKILDNAEGRADTRLSGMGESIKKIDSDISLLDPVMSEIVYRWFTPKVERPKCFDCFAGDTVFGFVSSYLGGDFTGIELREEQAAFNNARVEEFGLNARYICDDGRNVLGHIERGSQDLFFSCPPYFDIEVYSDKPNDASNQKSYADFYKILDEAFAGAIECLKEDRFAVVVCGDVRSKKGGGYYNFPNDIVNSFTSRGMLFYNELILVNSYGSAPMRAASYMKNRKCVKVHQNVLVFYKGDPKNIAGIFGDVEVGELEGFFDAGENE